MNKSSNTNTHIEKLSWLEVSTDVRNVNPDFAAIIDEISPDESFSLFRVNYSYGSEVAKDGVLNIPNYEGRLVPITDQSIDAKIAKMLGYNFHTHPVSMVLHGALEVFFILGSHTIPLYGAIPPGKIFGSWPLLSKSSNVPVFLWEMTSGARSLIMLPGIANTKSHKRLQKILRTNIDVPKKLNNQWYVFREIANHSQWKSPWQTSVLFFSQKWLQHLNDKAWMPFHRYLLDLAWQGSEYWRNQFAWNMIFSLIKKRKNIKPDPYIDDTARNLLGIGLGAVPGFQLAVDNSIAPIDRIQQAYVEWYGLKDYSPLIMQPALLNDDRLVYYSLKYPTTTSFSPKSNNLSTTVSDLHMVHWLLEKYTDALMNDNLNIDDSYLYKIVHELECRFFHPNHQDYSAISSTVDIVKTDKQFSRVMKRFKNETFPYSSDFLNGVISLKLNQ